MTPFQLEPSVTRLLGVTLVLYTLLMYVLSFVAQRRIHTTEDFLVAGRRLPLSLAWATLMATWFGAGTILTVTDEVRHEGFRRAALDPLGAGLCLIIAGVFFARPLWKMGLMTLSDFFARKFGPRAEVVSAAIMVPTYFGWVAAQFVALAGMLNLFFDIELNLAIALVAVIAMGYTLLGGMWSVTLTDALQLVLVLAGLTVLGWTAVQTLGHGRLGLGLVRLVMETPPEMLAPFPTESRLAFFEWLAVLTVGALGNVPGQDLMQRVFSAKSPAVARHACLLAGTGYLGFGLIPVALGLSARLLLPRDVEQAIIPALASIFLTPAILTIFMVALASAVLSTIDSAILSPASVLSQNLLEKLNHGRIPALTLNRIAVVGVTSGSLAMAYAGEDAYALLEDAYELPLVGLFVPLALGLYGRTRGELPALASMIAGTGLWTLHYFAGWDHFFAPWLVPRGAPLPVSLSLAACSLAAYLMAHAFARATPRA